MRLAIAISSSRESQFDRADLAQVDANGVVRALGRFCLLDLGRCRAPHLDKLVVLTLLLSGLIALLGLFLPLSFLRFHDVNAHVVERRKNVLDLLRSDLIRRQCRVDVLVCHVAARLGGLDHLADGGIRQIEQRQQGIWRFEGLFLLRLFLSVRRRHLGLVYHAYLSRWRPGKSTPRPSY